MADCEITVIQTTPQVVETPGATIIQDATTVQTVEAPGATIVAPTTTIDVITQGIQGAAGVPEEDKTFSKRVDIIEDSPSANITTIYRAEATVGASEAAAVWRLRRIRIDDNTEGDIEEVWAEQAGNPTAEFVHVWNDRLTLGYS